jgi:hypothetical protein
MTSEVIMFSICVFRNGVRCHISSHDFLRHFLCSLKAMMLLLLKAFFTFGLQEQLYVLYSFWRSIFSSCCLFWFWLYSQVIKMSFFRPWCSVKRTVGPQLKLTRAIQMMSRARRVPFLRAWAGPSLSFNTWRVMWVHSGRQEKERLFSSSFLYYFF